MIPDIVAFTEEYVSKPTVMLRAITGIPTFRVDRLVHDIQIDKGMCECIVFALLK